MKQFSRRSALFSAAIIPAAAAAGHTQSAATDGALLALGRRFDSIAAQLDDHSLDTGWDTLCEFDRVLTEIVGIPATTIEGLCVKARVGCWTMLGDFESADESAAGAQMAFSIMRDLIRLRYPHLENPGAVKRLFEEIEESAKSQTAAPTGGATAARAAGGTQ
jgi:hypothetical protein